MFAVVRAAIRAFAVGVVVGVLFAPRAGAQTRKMLSERIAAAFDQLVELGGLPPVPPDRAHTNGHAERAPAKRTRAAGTDARTS
jgi:hypothetical protein